MNKGLVSGWARIPQGLSDSDVALDRDTWLSGCADGRQPREHSARATRSRASAETSGWPRDMEPHHSCPVSDLGLVSMARKLSLCRGRARLLSPLSPSCSTSLETNSLGGGRYVGKINAAFQILSPGELGQAAAARWKRFEGWTQESSAAPSGRLAEQGRRSRQIKVPVTG